MSQWACSVLVTLFTTVTTRMAQRFEVSSRESCTAAVEERDLRRNPGRDVIVIRPDE
jgi:hypothetical protein